MSLRDDGVRLSLRDDVGPRVLGLDDLPCPRGGNLAEDGEPAVVVPVAVPEVAQAESPLVIATAHGEHPAASVGTAPGVLERGHEREVETQLLVLRAEREQVERMDLLLPIRIRRDPVRNLLVRPVPLRDLHGLEEVDAPVVDAAQPARRVVLRGRIGLAVADVCALLDECAEARRVLGIVLAVVHLELEEVVACRRAALLSMIRFHLPSSSFFFCHPDQIPLVSKRRISYVS